MKYLDKFYEEWYLDYASYVILERAVPKLEDGLKPVQRRILHSMFEMHDNRFHKVANIIGHSMKYHPHGDASIGDALVNLTHRSMLIETQGNFGDVRTGDKAAAPRYIEAKLSNFAVDISINKRLTTFQDSYDGRNKEPVALSMKFPILLLNGVDGIAVGLSTKILPHNFQELLKASIAILNEKTYRIVPDFENGGFIDVDDYKMGKKGGKVRLRSEIEISSKDQIIIKSVPYTVTTGSLIDSILKANENGKIKIKNIEDNTAEDVNITINLPKGISPNKTIDGLYLFTQCEISISPNCCIIKNNKPVFTNVNEVLSDSVYQTRNLLKSELELEKSDLEHKWHLLSLEKIFIENKIYRMIEDATEWEEVIDIIKTALKPFIAKLKKPLTQDDIIHLTELKIKKISKYDIDKTKDKLIYLNNNIDEVTNHIVHIKEYTIRFFEKILEKYGTDKSRKTKIEKFDTIKVKQAALTNKKLYIDYEQGFCGFSLKDKEFFTLDSRSYDIGVYNNFVDFFNGDSEIEDVNTNIKQYSTPLIVEKHERNPSTVNLKQGDLFSIDERLVKWNLYLQGETKNGETNTFWDWSGTSPNERDLSQYYKVLMPGGVSDYSSYKFTPVNENQVPAELKVMEMNTLERGNSYMPHIKSNSDKLWEEEIKNNTDNAFNIDSIPYDYSCFDCDNGGCDTTVYETTLDDGSMIKYRWYRFKDQPTFKYLSIDYPEIYTEEYLDFLQLKIEKMHKEWGHNQEFISKPNSLENFHLVELDNGMVVEPPSGKEFGWVPIVIEVEIPYGKYVTDRNYYDLSCGTFPGDPSCNLNDINGQEGRKMIATDGAYRVSTP